MVAMPDTIEARSEAVRLIASDGVEIALQTWGRAGSPTLLFTHGFGQTGAAWNGSARQLAQIGFRCVTLDARGHGESAWTDTAGYVMDRFIADLVEIAHYCGPDTVLIGASMGGLVGLVAEAEHGPLFRAMVVVDITPRWEAAGVERIIGFMRAHPYGFASLDAAADAIATYLPQRRERKTPEQLRGLLREGEDGRWRWHWDPRLLDNVADHGVQHQQRLVASAQKICAPLLLLSGGDSDVVAPATIGEFLSLVPHARHQVVPRATHMLVGDRNDAFTDSVLGFIRTLGSSRP